MREKESERECKKERERERERDSEKEGHYAHMKGRNKNTQVSHSSEHIRYDILIHICISPLE